MEELAGSSKKTFSQLKIIKFINKNRLIYFFFTILLLFPFLFSLFSGIPLSDGVSKFWQGQLIAVFIMAVYAMSYDLLMGYTGILSFGHAAFFGGGAYTMALFLSHVAPKIMASYKITLPGGTDITETLLFIVALILVFIVSVLLGLLFSGTSARVKGVYFAMITLAISDAIYILSKATDFAKWTGADEGLHGVPVPAWINPTQNRLLFYFVALIFMIVMYFFLKRVTDSPIGKVLVAMRENESRVKMIGYNPAAYRTYAFVISAVVAGFAGALYSLWNMSATPSMTASLSTINVLIMTILGGIGTLSGPILGAALMHIISQFFYQWFGARWPLVFGIIFILIVLFLPYGIVGTYQMKKYEIKSGWNRFIKLFKSNDG